MASTPARFAFGQPVARPSKSCVFVGMGFGVTSRLWFPEKTEHLQRDYELTPGLAPLKRHRNDFTLIQNLSPDHSGPAHSGTYTWLSCADLHRIPGQQTNSVSCDQVAAELVGRHTRFDDLRIIGLEGKDDYGHSIEGAKTISFDKQGRSLDGVTGAVGLYKRIFGSDDEDIEKIRYRFNREKSILDGLAQDAKRLGSHLNADDRTRLDEYLTSIRELERKIAKAERWQEIPRPEAPFPSPIDQKLKPMDEMKIVYDLMAIALQTDVTRVITLRHPVAQLLKQMGAKINSHNMSHHFGKNFSDERVQVSSDRDRMTSELFAHFLDRCKKAKFADGSCVLDHTTITMGTGLRVGHGTRNVPTIVAGGGSGTFQHGRNLTYKADNTPLSNLWYTVLKNMDERVESFAGSQQLIEDLYV